MAAIIDVFRRRDNQVRVGRIEPKQFYANERTFLTWLNMATTVGSISSALVAFGLKDAKHAGGVSVLATVLVLLAIIFCVYASEFLLFLQEQRHKVYSRHNVRDPARELGCRLSNTFYEPLLIHCILGWG